MQRLCPARLLPRASTAAQLCRRLPPCRTHRAARSAPHPAGPPRQPLNHAVGAGGARRSLPGLRAGHPAGRAHLPTSGAPPAALQTARPSHAATSAFTVTHATLLPLAIIDNICDEYCSCPLQEGEASEPGYAHLSCAKASLPSSPPAAPQAAVRAIVCTTTAHGCRTWKADVGLPLARPLLQHSTAATHPPVPATLPLAGVQALALPRLLPVWRVLRVSPPSRVLGRAEPAAASAGVRRRGRLHVDKGLAECRLGLALPCLAQGWHHTSAEC